MMAADQPIQRGEYLKGSTKYKNQFSVSRDLVKRKLDWKSRLIVKLSPWINLDSTVDKLRKNSEKEFDTELRKLSRMELSAVLIKLKSENCANTARLVSKKLRATAADNMTSQKDMFQVYVQLPMQEVQKQSQTLNKDENSRDTWRWWVTFRAVCTAHDRLGVALEISVVLPSQDVINRWLGEPVRCIIIPTSVFEINKRGFPILPRIHQNLVRQFFKLNVTYIISPSNSRQDVYYYDKYMDQLWNSQPADDFLAQSSRGYEDKLGTPLQPLRDNLEPGDYEVFEKDPVKYTKYQKAIYQALSDRVPEKEKYTTTSVVMVVGAGRGPLVTATLKAAEKSQRLVQVYAIEKNPKAVVTLLELKDKKWDKNVTVVFCDMRYWDAPEKADLIISELLGSFGDNELSPECLDGAQKFLKDGGFMIPESYTSYLGPIQSQKLHLEASQFHENHLHPNKPYNDSLERPYGVRIHNKFEMHKPKPLFTFDHPKIDPTDDNTRYKSLTFRVKIDSILHGFAGYFDAILYKNIKLSIVPETHTEGMFSWFPIYFPIKDGVFISANSDIEVDFWRCCDVNQVWYEYCLTKPVSSGIHNPNGRSYAIGLKSEP